MLLRGTPIWRPENNVNIWNVLWLSRELIICTEQRSIYISTFPNTLTSEKVINHELYMLFAGWEVHIVKNRDRDLENAARGRKNIYKSTYKNIFFDKRDRRSVSQTAVNLKFKMRRFPKEAH